MPISTDAAAPNIGSGMFDRSAPMPGRSAVLASAVSYVSTSGIARSSRHVFAVTCSSTSLLLIIMSGSTTTSALKSSVVTVPFATRSYLPSASFATRIPKVSPGPR